MSIKLIVSDMDGTLIDKSELVPNSAVEMVKKLKQAGIMFTVATGRVECMAQEYIKKLCIEIPYIACNGATIISPQKIIQKKQIKISCLKELILKADDMGMSIIYTIDGKEFVFRPTNWIMDQREKFHRYYDEHIFTEKEWTNILVDKITIMDDIRDGKILIIENMCKEFSDRYCFTRYTNKAIEVVEKNANKANAIKVLANELNIDMKDIMAIGDHENDVEMLSEVGLSVAVGNALPHVKEIADYVCENNYTQGVIEAVEKFCLKQTK